MEQKRIVYIAHPLGAGEDRELNRANAARWVAWAALFHDVAPVATWITLSGEWAEEPHLRERGLIIDFALIERCDELWGVGGRWSPGMVIEADHARRVGVPVCDLADLGPTPPTGPHPEMLQRGPTRFAARFVRGR